MEGRAIIPILLFFSLINLLKPLLCSCSFGSVEILNLIQITSTIFLSMLYTKSLVFTSFTWLRNFLDLSFSPNFRFTTKNVVSVIFLRLYLVLSKLRCNCFLYFPLIFFLFLCLKGIIESALISSLINSVFFLNHTLYTSHNIQTSLSYLIV